MSNTHEIERHKILLSQLAFALRSCAAPDRKEPYSGIAADDMLPLAAAIEYALAALDAGDAA